MLDILQKLQRETPENYSSFLEVAPENPPVTPASPEIRQYQERQTRRELNARSVVSLVNTRAEQNTGVIENSRLIAATMTDVGEHIMQARKREIALDGGLSRRLTLASRSEVKLSFAEVVLGKKASRAVRRGVANFSDLHLSDYSDKNTEYIRREADVSKRMLGQGNVQLFCLDNNTWVWHKDGDEQMTFLYHVRPDGVLRQRISGDERRIDDEPVRIYGDELRHLGYWTSRYHAEVQNTVYRQQPETSSDHYGTWSAPPAPSLSYN